MIECAKLIIMNIILCFKLPNVTHFRLYNAEMNVVNTNFEGDVIGITVARSSIILPGEQLQEHTGLLSGIAIMHL